MTNREQIEVRFGEVVHSLGGIAIMAILLFGCVTSRNVDAEIATELDDHAELLAEGGETALSAEVAGQAARLREADAWNRRQARAMAEGRPPETSFWLGFAPDRVLERYAAELRAVGKAAEAARVEEPATAYPAEQARAVEQLRRR